MEITNCKYAEKEMAQVGSGQVRVPANIELKTAGKKILNITAAIFTDPPEKKENETTVTGRVKTRVIYIDEFDGFNSEESTDGFKYTCKGAGEIPEAILINTTAPKVTNNEDNMIATVSVEHTVDVNLIGFSKKEINYVEGMSGDNVELQTTDMAVSTFGDCFFEKFDIGEHFEIDQNASGVLATDINVSVKEITAGVDKFTVKGIASVHIAIIKNSDGACIIQNNFHDFDFTKTFNKKGVTESDIIHGNLIAIDMSAKVENRGGVSLTVEAELGFCGYVVSNNDIKIVTDAFSPSHDIRLDHADVKTVQAILQNHITADVEGNVTMPDGSPFITRVLAAFVPSIAGVNIKPADDKVVVEGIIDCPLIYECEEHNTHAHNASVPFSVNCKIDGVTPNSNVFTNVVAANCGIKARRGRELMIDVRLAVGISVHEASTCEIVTNAVNLPVETQKAGLIHIHVATAGEDLWAIAKRVKVPTKEILSQNPDIEKGINDGDRITIYKKAAN